ncbi:MAG: hypothetical protein K2I74_06910, partial [Treponemataceae bacterium]|nr:hypothetical protein [Treponemataceae bacterium]
MTEAEKAVYDEEDPEIPADLFSLWAKTEFTDDEEESAGQEQIAEAPAELSELAGDDPEGVVTAEHVEFADNASEAETMADADGESSELSEPTLDDDEMAYLTSANDATASAEQETIADFGDVGAKS